MTSYFDEHDCVPLGENERPNEHILLARLLLDSGIANALNLDYTNFQETASNLAPPTSKNWLSNEYPKYCFDESDRVGHQCPICLVKFSEGIDAKAVRLPTCGHTYHSECLIRWLNKTSSCPLCRQEFPTDDPNYEEFKRQKKREKEREKELEALHDSMFT